MYPLIRPTVPAPEAWLPYLATAYDERRFSNFGPVASRLERELERRYAPPGRSVVLVASGTAGLTAALLALDVSGAVAMPSFTFPASAAAVRLAGCAPLFVDVAQDTWELDLSALEDTLARHPVRAILHVRTLGLCRPTRELEELAGAHGIPLIVDGAASLGGSHDDGTWIGASGDAEVFSMHATKVFGVGEGGAVFAREGIADRVREAINFGLHDGSPRTLGFNGKLGEVSAAIGLSVLDRISAFVGRRAELAARYRAELDAGGGVEHARAPGCPPWQTYPVRFHGDASHAVATLAAAGVGARRYYTPPLHRAAPFASEVDLPVTDELAAEMICLPVYSDMTNAEQDAIIAITNRTLAESPR